MIINNLSEILGRKRLKISNVIKETGITRPTLTSLYYDKSKGINFDTLNTLCNNLDITPGELFTFCPADISEIKVNSINYDSIDEITFFCKVTFEQKNIAPLNFAGLLQPCNEKDASGKDLSDLVCAFDLESEKTLKTLNSFSELAMAKIERQIEEYIEKVFTPPIKISGGFYETTNTPAPADQGADESPTE